MAVFMHDGAIVIPLDRAYPVQCPWLEVTAGIQPPSDDAPDLAGTVTPVWVRLSPIWTGSLITPPDFERLTPVASLTSGTLWEPGQSPFMPAGPVAQLVVQIDAPSRGLDGHVLQRWIGELWDAFGSLNIDIGHIVARTLEDLRVLNRISLRRHWRFGDARDFQSLYSVLATLMGAESLPDLTS